MCTSSCRAGKAMELAREQRNRPMQGSARAAFSATAAAVARRVCCETELPGLLPLRMRVVHCGPQVWTHFAPLTSLMPFLFSSRARALLPSPYSPFALGNLNRSINSSQAQSLSYRIALLSIRPRSILIARSIPRKLNHFHTESPPSVTRARRRP